MSKPRRVRKGERLLAADHNGLVDALENGVRGLRPGVGLLGLFGNVIDLARLDGLAIIPARVTGAPIALEIEEPDCRYSIRAIHDTSWVLDGHRPQYGRLFVGPGILMQPAPVGSFCFMVREWDGGGKYKVDAWVIREHYLTTFCPDPPAPQAQPRPSRREVIEVQIAGKGQGGPGATFSPAPIPPPSGGIA